MAASIFEDIFHCLTWEKKIREQPKWTIEYSWYEQQWIGALKTIKTMQEKGKEFQRELYLYQHDGKAVLAIKKREFKEQAVA